MTYQSRRFFTMPSPHGEAVPASTRNRKKLCWLSLLSLSCLSGNNSTIQIPNASSVSSPVSPTMADPGKQKFIIASMCNNSNNQYSPDMQCLLSIIPYHFLPEEAEEKRSISISLHNSRSSHFDSGIRVLCELKPINKLKVGIRALCELKPFK